MSSKKNVGAGFSPPARLARLKPGATFLAIAAFVAVAIAAFFAFRARRSAGAPDIILVTIDTLRVDGVSFTGSTKARTPFLDELARDGIYFSNAHSHNVVTFPSHTNILTGLLPYQHGVRDNAGFTLDPKHHTIAHYLKKNGYATGAFVASFPLDARFGLTPDFDVYNDEYPEGTSPNAFTVPERPAEQVLAPAVEWWESITDRKKFMWVHIYEPHVPYKPRSPFKEQYQNPYYAEVASADDSLGRALRPLLEKSPDALVIVTADHGEGMGEHGEVTHGLFAYEETLHIPLIVYQKGRIKPRIEKNFVRHIDIVPTILERAGIEKPKELLGASLLAVKEARNTYFEALTSSLNLGWAPLIGMIHEGHKYIELPLAELYDLPNDPREQSNRLRENRRMTTKIRALLASSAPGANAGVERADITPEEAKNLMALGYLTGTAAAKKSYTEADDPKTLVPFFSRMNRAVMLYGEGKWSEALVVAKKLVADRPEMTQAKDILAFLLQQTEHSGEAEHLLREAIKNGTATDTMKKRLGLLLSERGDAAEAVQILSTFENSKDPELINAYGIALADLGRIPEAIREFESALKIDPTNATAYQNLGVVALRVNDLPRAQQFLGRALELNPKMPLALNTMGVLYARQNDFPRAVDAWTRAVAIDPRQFDALFNIGLVAGRSGQRDRARQALSQFVKTAPPERYARDIATAKQALVALQ